MGGKDVKALEQKVDNAKCRENFWAYYEYLMIRKTPLLKAIKRAYHQIFDALNNLFDMLNNQVARRGLLDAWNNLAPYLYWSPLIDWKKKKVEVSTFGWWVDVNLSITCILNNLSRIVVNDD